MGDLWNVEADYNSGCTEKGDQRQRDEKANQARSSNSIGRSSGEIRHFKAPEPEGLGILGNIKKL